MYLKIYFTALKAISLTIDLNTINLQLNNLTTFDFTIIVIVIIMSQLFQIYDEVNINLLKHYLNNYFIFELEFQVILSEINNFFKQHFIQ